MELLIKGRQHPRQSLLVGCGQICFPSSQIAEFFYSLWKESSDLRKVAPEAISF